MPSPFLRTILGFDDKSPKQINYIIRKPLAEQGLCATALCHQRVRKASAKLYPARRRAESTCATRVMLHDHSNNLSASRRERPARTFPRALSLMMGLEVESIRTTNIDRFQMPIGSISTVRANAVRKSPPNNLG